jgi:diaminopimelate epimerase
VIPFRKMQGIGNDFVMIDAVRHPIPGERLPDLAVHLCDRRLGVGGDGLILILPGSKAPHRMRMFNPDGSESEMCGNGVRCFARMLRDLGYVESEVCRVETEAGVLELRFVGDDVRVAMGPARMLRGEIGMAGPADAQFVEEPVAEDLPLLGTAVSMGNPHLVIFVDDVASVPLALLGPRLERSPLFPSRVNVHFAQVMGRGRIIQRTWERGAGATLACGTGACATAVAACRTGRTDTRVEVRLPGGILHIEVDPDGEVWMTGAAELVFEGVWPLPTPAASGDEPESTRN